ncbi:MAG: hypothetical protein UT36_C0004G0047 [Candidatus Peregrinibacteria bacterium GW2011_GWF2_39_17]|nr:MAG: hypothetical protein UT36_C0004G0047 [Candidatus Peregrinibacteria bacterium GW2011_GWF2_39_17]HCW32667.1 hypothetical protein [Candidatus Peregrinibacteria bacterium]
MSLSPTFKLNIRTPDQKIYENEARSISLNSDDGQMQIFANHASLTTSITFSKIVVTEENVEEIFMVRNGMLFINNQENTAILLALYCQKQSEVSHQTSKEYLEFLEKQLHDGSDLSEFQILYLEGEKLAVEQQLVGMGNNPLAK